MTRCDGLAANGNESRLVIHLRHSKFVGLREDKEAREVVREIGVSYDSEALPELGIGSVTNGDIDHYYGKQ
jgi:hypothetical protein